MADRVVVGAFMLTYVASAVFGASGYDTARDVAEAYAIRHLHALPLHGPLLAGTLHLGPIWFYLLALPLLLHESWLSVALFATALGSLQFPLAYAAGRRLADRRLGLLWCAALALPGWGSFELVGFGHSTAVRVCTMLVLYAVIRLVQERRPLWLVLAGLGFGLALHAHPSTIGLALVIAAAALYALRDVRTLLAASVASLLVAVLPFMPIAIEQVSAPSSEMSRAGEMIESTVHIGNVLQVPAFLYGVLVRGPRIMSDAFLAALPGSSTALQLVIFVIQGLALAGLIAAFVGHRALMLIGVAATITVAMTIAWMRAATPFWMTFALVPFIAALIALGLYALGERLGTRAGIAAATFVGVILALHVAMEAGIAHTISSGEVTMPVMSRLDIKRDDPAPALPEPWFPAYGVDRSGALLCGQTGDVVLHGTYAYLADAYFGLDHRLHCGVHDVRLLGVDPASASHLVGLSQALWSAIGWQPQRAIAGLGIAPATQVLSPARGFSVPDGLTYPPYQLPGEPVRTLQLDASAARDHVLVISLPYLTWMLAPVINVTANGQPQNPSARDAVSLVYACGPCAMDGMVQWRIAIESAAPERVDVVMLAPRPR